MPTLWVFFWGGVGGAGINLHLPDPPPCIACDLNTDLESAHTPAIETLSSPPHLIRFFRNYAALKGEMDAFNHLSYQLCAKQQPH